MTKLGARNNILCMHAYVCKCVYVCVKYVFMLIVKTISILKEKYTSLTATLYNITNRISYTEAESASNVHNLKLLVSVEWNGGCHKTGGRPDSKIRLF